LKYERDKLQAALNQVKVTVKSTVPKLTDIQAERNNVVAENEKLKFELI